MLAMVPWIVASDGPTLAEVCRRFDIAERDLLADLNLLFMCGVYPFTPDSLIEVDIDDGRVWVRCADWFRRPVRLTPPEGLALVAAARAMLSLRAENLDSASDFETRPAALARAAAKLESVLGGGGEQAVDVELGYASPEVMGALQQAVRESRKVELSYYSFGRDQTSDRVVRPWRLFSSESNWYLLAFCESVGGRRLFRVDRVRSAQLLDEQFEAPTDLGTVPIYEARPDDPVVVLDLSPAAGWVADRYPSEESLDLGQGYTRVRLRVSSTAWLERLLLRAGPDATVVSGAQGVAEAAAQRLLAVYRPVPLGNGPD